MLDYLPGCREGAGNLLPCCNPDWTFGHTGPQHRPSQHPGSVQRFPEQSWLWDQSCGPGLVLDLQGQEQREENHPMGFSYGSMSIVIRAIATCCSLLQIWVAVIGVAGTPGHQDSCLVLVWGGARQARSHGCAQLLAFIVLHMNLP